MTGTRFYILFAVCVLYLVYLYRIYLCKYTYGFYHVHIEVICTHYNTLYMQYIHYLWTIYLLGPIRRQTSCKHLAAEAAQSAANKLAADPIIVKVPPRVEAKAKGILRSTILISQPKRWWCEYYIWVHSVLPKILMSTSFKHNQTLCPKVFQMGFPLTFPGFA